MAENAGKTTVLEDEEAEKMEDRQFHINCAAGEIGKYVLLTGDPDRVPEIAAHLEHSRKVAQKRSLPRIPERWRVCR